MESVELQADVRQLELAALQFEQMIESRIQMNKFNIFSLKLPTLLTSACYRHVYGEVSCVL